MKLEPLVKLDNRKKITSKHFEDNVMLVNGDVIVILTIYGQLGAIRKPDSGPLVCKTYIFIRINLLSYKN